MRLGHFALPLLLATACTIQDPALPSGMQFYPLAPKGNIGAVQVDTFLRPITLQVSGNKYSDDIISGSYYATYGRRGEKRQSVEITCTKKNDGWAPLSMNFNGETILDVGYNEYDDPADAIIRVLRGDKNPTMVYASRNPSFGVDSRHYTVASRYTPRSMIGIALDTCYEMGQFVSAKRNSAKSR